MVAKVGREYGLERAWSMTPRELSAYETMLFWEEERYLANLATAVRIAQNADKEGFESYRRQAMR